MHEKRDLERMAFKSYIHPQGDFYNGYYDICDIEKGTFDCDNMRLGEVYPVILYAHHETMLTVGCVVRTSDHPDIVTGEEQLALWIYYPSAENIESFDIDKWLGVVRKSKDMKFFIVLMILLLKHGLMSCQMHFPILKCMRLPSLFQKVVGIMIILMRMVDAPSSMWNVVQST